MYRHGVTYHGPAAKVGLFLMSVGFWPIDIITITVKMSHAATTQNSPYALCGARPFSG